MNFITLKELKKMVPVASEFKRVPGLKKILEDGIEVILRKQMENHAEVVVYKNGYVSYHAHERYTVFALHNCTHYYYESQGNEHQTIPHDHFEDMEWHIRLVLEGEDRLVRNIEARESETFSYAADVNPEYNNEMEDPRINVMDFVLNKLKLLKANHTSQIYSLESDIARRYPREIATAKGQIEALKTDMEAAKPLLAQDKDHFAIEISGKVYTERKEAGAAIIEACKALKAAGTEGRIGSYGAFELHSRFDNFDKVFRLSIKGAWNYSMEVGKDPLGNILRVTNALAALRAGKYPSKIFAGASNSLW